MFPTFISILDIQSWWEVPSIAHFCSLFRTAFNLLDFDIEDLEEALLTDGTEETSWLQELIVRLLSGCLPNNEISTFNYQMFLRRLFRQKCQEHDRYNPFNTDCDFTLLPLKTKVDILHALCDFRLDAEDVLDQLKNLEADSLRVEPLGFDQNDSAYWYFYGTRLYREDFEKKNNKKKAVWQVICFTEEDWFQLTKKFKSSSIKSERALYHTLSKNFLPELPRLFKEKERQARRRLLENQPRRTSDRIRKADLGNSAEGNQLPEEDSSETVKKEESEAKKNCEKRTKHKHINEESESDQEVRHEMAAKKKTKSKQKKPSPSSDSSDNESSGKRRKTRAQEEAPPVIPPKPVGRQTNNSLSALDGQIVIQGAAQPPSNKKKLKTSQVFQQTDEDLQVGMHKILDFVKNHDDAWPFLDPVEEEYAPNYYSIIRRPMDLTKMEEKLDHGHYKNFDKFKADFQLIVNNCRLYNGVENEYTEMVDNLVKVFEKATEKYLDQISSSDEEIAVENHEEEVRSVKSTKKKSSESPPRSTKPTATAASKKRERSVSEEPEEILETKSKKPKKTQEKESSKKETKPLEKEEKKSQKRVEKESSKPSKDTKPLKEASKARDSPKPVREPAKPEKSKKERSASPEVHKKSSKSKSKKESSKPKSKSKKTKKKTHKRRRDNSPRRSSSRSPSPSPPRSVLSTPPPSSPEASLPKSATLPRCKEDTKQPSPFPWEIAEEPPPSSPETHKKLDEVAPYSPLAFGFKDKHNKLRETIEKLKAKSEIGRMYTDLEIEDQLKENKDKNKKAEPKPHSKGKKNHADSVIVLDSDSPVGERKAVKNKKDSPPAPIKPASNFEALSLATEQTLKDINKWLDDTPKFADFGSASNSPSYLGMDDFDLLGTPKPEPKKPVFDVLNIKPKDPTVVKEVKKKSFKDPSKFFGKRREVQRTIDRLQPGKGKGNLITNVQSTTKAEDIFPLGPLSKIKDTKNSLIVKTDTNAPKLSLGSVLDSFGKHKFAEDDRKSPHQEESVQKPAPPAAVEVPETEKVTPPASEPTDLKESTVTEKEVKETESNAAAGGPTPNLSAWFKAFGAPKAPPPLKKPTDKTDSKDEDVDVAPSESPQPVPRQRKISTGSSVSERSSFSQDLDSPRVGMEERGAYPAPYPSPLHSGASPVTNSPRPDISPRSPYPPFNGGQLRAGFYQDTVSSSKSSPEKSCSPRENVQNSPYYQPAHVYAPNTTAQGALYTGTSPYYTHAPNYSSTNPTPPYNMDGGSNAYYDTSKIMDQYQAKPSQNYTANSPASSQNSPATQPQMSPHSPMVLLPQTSPSVHSPSIHSPSIHSPSMHSSPGQSLHSPGMGVVSPGMGVVSPSMGVVSPQVNSPQMQPSPAAVNSPGMVNSPLNNAEPESAEVPPAVTPAFPVKKRAFIDTDMSQFAALQEDMANQRRIQMSEQEAAQLQHQQQQQQQQQKLQEQHELHMQQQQQQQQQQQYLQQQQNQAMAAFVKTTMASNEALRIPSPRQQITNQKVSNKNVPYPTSTSATTQFGGSYGSREPTYPFNVPVSRPLPTDHQQKFDMSKFTNMGYSGPEVNFSKALQQQYARSELSYVRTTVQSAISQASQLLSSQSLSINQPVASSVNSLPGYQKTATNQQQAHVNSPYQTGRATVDSVAERLAAHVQQEAAVGYKQDARNNYNSGSLDLEQAMGLSRNLSVMAGLQSAPNPYYSDKGHVFNKQLFGQNAGANMGYGQQQQMQPQQPQSMYGRQMAPAEMQTHDLKTAVAQDRKSRKKKSNSSKVPEAPSAMTAPGGVVSGQTAPPQQHAFQSYVGIKSGSTPTPTGAATGPLDSAIASLKNPPAVPGSAFNFGLTESYPNLLDDFRSPSNYFMGGAAAKPPHGQPGQSYPAFLNPAHQSRGGTYPPLGGFMDTGSHQFYQHYLSQAGVLNQGLLGAAAAAAGGYAPPAYHLAMRQPYDAMSRPSWL